MSKRDNFCFHGTCVLGGIETKNLISNSMTLCVKNTVCHGKIKQMIVGIEEIAILHRIRERDLNEEMTII